MKWRCIIGGVSDAFIPYLFALVWSLLVTQAFMIRPCSADQTKDGDGDGRMEELFLRG